MTAPELHNPRGAHSVLFTTDELPEPVFQRVVTSCAWISMDALCCIEGWTLLSTLARQHGDTSVQIIGLDLREPRVATLETDANADSYRALCDDELVGANVIRWSGTSGHWGIHGSRDLEIAVAGQVDDFRWPRSADCAVLTIDAAMRLAQASDAVRAQMMEKYDALSWDPAAEDHRALPELINVCRGVLADQVDPVVAIRGLVDLLDRVPKHVRRIPATRCLHQAWTRTGYLLLGPAREQFGPLLLAQNNMNHERHSMEERPIVQHVAEAILAGIEGSSRS